MGELALPERLHVYSEGDKRMFIRARDATGEAVASLKAVAEEPTPNLIQVAITKVTQAALEVRLLAAALEENRRMLAEEANDATQAGVQPEGDLR